MEIAVDAELCHPSKQLITRVTERDAEWPWPSGMLPVTSRNEDTDRCCFAHQGRRISPLIQIRVAIPFLNLPIERPSSVAQGVNLGQGGHGS
jgi:hypothetical protein